MLESGFKAMGSSRTALPLMSNSIVQNVVGSVLYDDQLHHHMSSNNLAPDVLVSKENGCSQATQSLASRTWRKDDMTLESFQHRPSVASRKTLYNYQEYPPSCYPYPTNFPMERPEQLQWFQQPTGDLSHENDPDNALRIALALLRFQGQESLPSTPSSGDSGRFSFSPPPKDLDYYRNVPPPSFPNSDQSGRLSSLGTYTRIDRQLLERPRSVPPMPTESFGTRSPDLNVWGGQGRYENSDCSMTTSCGLKLYKVTDGLCPVKLLLDAKLRSQESSHDFSAVPTTSAREEYISLLLLCNSRLDEVQDLCLRLKGVVDECPIGKTFTLSDVSLLQSSTSGGRSGIDTIIGEVETFYLTFASFLSNVESSLYNSPTRYYAAAKTLSDAIHEIKRLRSIEKRSSSKLKKNRQGPTQEVAQMFVTPLRDLLKALDDLILFTKKCREDVTTTFFSTEDDSSDDLEFFHRLDAKTIWDMLPDSE